MIKFRTAVILVFTFSVCRAYSQDELLGKTINISYGRISKYEALKRIGYELGVSFSYKEGLLRNNDIITIDYSDKSVSEILAEIFAGDALEYICDNNMVVIKPYVDPGTRHGTPLLFANGIQEPEITRVTSDSLFSICKLRLRGFDTPFVSDSISHEPEYNFSASQPAISDSSEIASSKSGNRHFHSVSYNAGSKSAAIQGKPIKLRGSVKDRQPEIILHKEAYNPDEALGSCDFNSPIITCKTGISVSPHITFVRDARIKGSIHGGVVQHIWYKDKIGYLTGIQFSSQRTTIYSGNGESAPITDIINVLYYGIPTCFSFTLFSSDRVRQYTSFGLYHYFFSNKQLPLNSSKKIGWLEYIDFSYAMELQWFSGFTCFIIPFIRYPLSKSDQFDLLIKTGISLGINYTF